MTATEKATLTTQFNALLASLMPAGEVAAYARKFVSDLDAITRGAGGTADILSGKYPVTVPVTTVALLPTGPVLNDEAIVTDSTVATNGGTVVGGSSTRVMVRYDGAAWKIV